MGAQPGGVGEKGTAPSILDRFPSGLARKQGNDQNGYGWDGWEERRGAWPMMSASPSTDPGIQPLLADAARGDEQAVRCLLEMYRQRLGRMIAARPDRRLAPRRDPSDVAQETLADAAQRLPDHLRGRPLPFYSWLFRLAADRLARAHRDHVASTVRGIGREERIDGASHDDATATRWGDRLPADDPTPRHHVVREERRVLLTGPIEQRDEADREVLGLRYLDRLAFDEIAAVLDIGLSAAKLWHLRSLEPLRGLLEGLGVEPSTSP
jgi:RNA polymerase sigma-70 factor (ECF subfamily)